VFWSSLFAFLAGGVLLVPLWRRRREAALFIPVPAILGVLGTAFSLWSLANLFLGACVLDPTILLPSLPECFFPIAAGASVSLFLYAQLLARRVFR
jgi:hypothetical protein